MAGEETSSDLTKKPSSPQGVSDILPDEHLYFTHIKKVVRHRCRQSGFRRITTPTYEFKDLYTTHLGETTELVRHELISFEDKKGRAVALRPEGTIGIARAYIEHHMENWPQPVELYYIEPFFRSGGSNRGSFHQFNQFGFEVLGEADPALDAQVLQLSHKILDDLGIAHLFKIQVNSTGCSECRAKYIEDLRNYYIGKERSMCQDCVVKLEKNPLRLLDCREEDCQILAQLAPKLKTYLCKACKAFHEKFVEYLKEMELPFEENENLVRGLDYYSRTVFEFWDPKLGAEIAVGGGGRYDELVEALGGPSVPGVGIAFGMERLIHHMKREKIDVPSKDDLHIFVAQLGDEAKKKCLNLIWELRERGIKTVGALGKGSVKEQLQLASKFKVPYTLILGITEVREGTVIIRDMAKGQQRSVASKSVVEEVVRLIGEKNLDMYSPGELVYS